MLSLLDLPDDLFPHIGTYFEYDLPQLGLFLLVHPRINTACKSLRYRSRTYIFDTEDSLKEYIDNKERLSSVRSIEIRGTYRRLREGDVTTGRTGSSLKDPETYDDELATVVSSFGSVHRVSVYVPHSANQGSTAGKRDVVSMKKTYEAISRHGEIQRFHIDGNPSEDDLAPALDLAGNLPNCHSLRIDQASVTADIPWPDILLPIARHLSLPSVAARLTSLILANLQFSAASIESVLTVLAHLPLLPLLTNLSFHLAYYSRQSTAASRATASILDGLLRKAQNVRTLTIFKEVLPYLAQQSISIPVNLRLICPGDIHTPVLWVSKHPTVRSLTLEGRSASHVSNLIMTGDVSGPSYPFPALLHLTIIGPISRGSAARAKEWAVKQPFTIDYLPPVSGLRDLVSAFSEKDVFVNPVGSGTMSRRVLEVGAFRAVPPA